ncbi:uncharacterized protein LOC134247439 isoform X2 [Saccostrea cucullata]|uniref:uncharacterized protein LOC134247439 isoform X2 n=1 Tax=Saccostrea cuccullata TaxID=36930 RepID=UPI002ED00EB2
MIPFIYIIIIIISSACNQVMAVEFDFFILVLQWPVTFCRIKNCAKEPPNKWTIHGLWPSNVIYCEHNESFQEKNIPENTKALMNDIWPDLTSKNGNRNFWSDEWRKHGTCADVDGTRSLAGYFTKAVDLAHRYSISSFLENSNITPNATTTYTIRNWIFEVRLCLDKTFNIINCNKNNGKGRVLYPPPSSPKHVKGGNKKNCKN